MKRIIEYINDVKWWASHYEKGWWKSPQSLRCGLWNALYCVAPARWKVYNRMLHFVFRV